MAITKTTVAPAATFTQNKITKLQHARYLILEDFPYLADAILALKPRVKRGLGTLAVDQYWRMYYDPETIEEWSAAAVAGTIVHEVFHLIRRHHYRGRNYADPDMANIAMDVAINPSIMEMGLKIPVALVIPSDKGLPENLTMEEYYALLKEQQQKGGQKQKQNQNGSGKGQGQGGGSGQKQQNNGNGQQDNNQEGDGQDDTYHGDKPHVGGGHCGSAATGRKAEWEEAPPENESQGLDDERSKMIARNVAQKMLNHQKTRGNLPAGLLRWAEELIQPEIPWYQLLTAHVRRIMGYQSGPTYSTYTRPNRRHYDSEVVFPGRGKPKQNVTVIIDTSGSMSDKELGHALAELRGVFKATPGVGVNVISCDAAASTAKRVMNLKQVTLQGGGGTDMRVGIEGALEKGNPSMIIVLTDGETPWPDAPVGIPIVAGIINNARAADKVPPFIKTVCIGQKREAEHDR